jgi:hypothetical protein
LESRQRFLLNFASPIKANIAPKQSLNPSLNIETNWDAIGIGTNALKIEMNTDSTRHVSPNVMTPVKIFEPLTTALSALRPWREGSVFWCGGPKTEEPSQRKPEEMVPRYRPVSSDRVQEGLEISWLSMENPPPKWTTNPIQAVLLVLLPKSRAHNITP